MQQRVCIASIENVPRGTFSPDGQRIVTDDDTKISVWCVQNGKLLRETKLHPTNLIRPGSVFSPDLGLLARKDYDIERLRDTSFSVYDVETGNRLVCITEVPQTIMHFNFSPCGKFLAVGGTKGTLQVWEWESERLHLTTEYGNGHIYPYYPPTGELLVAALSWSRRTVEVWHVETNEQIDTFACRGKGHAVFSESGALLVVENPGELYVWRKGDAEAHTLSTLHGHLSTVDSLAFSSDGMTLASAIWGGNVLLWNVSSRRSQRPKAAEIPGRNQIVHPSATGKILVTARDGENVKIWELGKSEPIAQFAEPDIGLHKSRYRRLRDEALSPSGQQFAMGDSEGNFHVWDWAPHQTPKHTLFKGPGKDGAYALAFSPDGKRLASIAHDWTGRLWDVDAETEVAKLPFTLPSKPGVLGMAFSPRGDVIAGAQWGEIVLWDATDGKTLRTLPQRDGNQKQPTLCFSPCGRYLVSGSWWQEGLKQMPIRLWDVASGANIATFYGHTTDVQCIAFSPDGTLMATGGHDGIILLWDLSPYIQ